MRKIKRNLRVEKEKKNTIASRYIDASNETACGN